MTHMHRRAVLMVPALAALATCLPGPAFALAANALRIGRKPTIEQELLAQMTVQLLWSRGIPVSLGRPQETALVRAAQERGEIDLYWEASGTALTTFERRRPPLPPGEADVGEARAVDADRGLVWLEESDVDSGFALAMRTAQARKLGISTISDLAKRLGEGRELTLGVSEEFFARPDGLKPLQTYYGFEWPNEQVERMPLDDLAGALQAHEIDVAAIENTDGHLQRQGLRLLRDDRNFFPPYTLTPVVRKAALEGRRPIERTLASLSEHLDTATMRKLNARIIEGEAPADVARDFLRSEGLIPRPDPRAHDAL